MSQDDGITLRLRRSVSTAVAPTPRVCEIAAMFGLGVDDSESLGNVTYLSVYLYFFGG